MDQAALRNRATTGWPEHNIRGFKIEENHPEITSYSPYEHIYGEFLEGEDFSPLYARSSSGEIFIDHIRLDIMKRMLTEPENDGGLELKYRELIADGTIAGFFPLHEYDVQFAIPLPIHFFSLTNYGVFRHSLQPVTTTDTPNYCTALLLWRTLPLVGSAVTCHGYSLTKRSRNTLGPRLPYTFSLSVSHLGCLFFGDACFQCSPTLTVLQATCPKALWPPPWLDLPFKSSSSSRQMWRVL